MPLAGRIRNLRAIQNGHHGRILREKSRYHPSEHPRESPRGYLGRYPGGNPREQRGGILASTAILGEFGIQSCHRTFLRGSLPVDLHGNISPLHHASVQFLPILQGCPWEDHLPDIHECGVNLPAIIEDRVSLLQHLDALVLRETLATFAEEDPKISSRHVSFSDTLRCPPHAAEGTRVVREACRSRCTPGRKTDNQLRPA